MALRKAVYRTQLLQSVPTLHHIFITNAEIGHVPTIHVTGTTTSYLFIVVVFFRQWLLEVLGL
jgi:hypothetical protein